MPTAADTAVFIKWERMEITPVPDSTHQNVQVQVTVNVAGTPVSSYLQFTSITSDDILDDLANALEDKRVAYVSA